MLTPAQLHEKVTAALPSPSTTPALPGVPVGKCAGCTINALIERIIARRGLISHAYLAPEVPYIEVQKLLADDFADHQEIRRLQPVAEADDGRR